METLWGILGYVLKDTLELKGIQTSQVLEAYKELSKSVTFELIWTLWHILLEIGPNVLKTQNNDISPYFLRILDVLTCFISISLLFLSHLFYNMYIFACMNMYVL